MLGTTIGQYRISQKIGAGGMGVVYLAEHTLLGRPAAVKMLLPELSQNREIVTRFFNEARAATAIRHPGIVEIYDFGFDAGGAAYIVMEHLQGESLAARTRRSRVSYHSALAITRQVASALAAAHGKGIVHRDLKPDNVFLVPDPDVQGGERIKLLDFGIAKLARDPSQGMDQVTQTGALMGTPRYMSPEQCRGVTVDHRADLYSLGCMLFELCTGRPPFVGEGMGDVLAAHIHVPPPAIASIAPDVPQQLDLLVQRLLAKDPGQRLGSAEEVIHAIDLAGLAPGYQTGPALARGPALPTPAPPGAPTVATGPGLPSAPNAASNAASMTTLSRGVGSLVSPPPEKPRARVGLIAGVAITAVLGGGIAVVAVSQGQGAGRSPGTLQAATEPAAARPEPVGPAPTSGEPEQPGPTSPGPTAVQPEQPQPEQPAQPEQPQPEQPGPTVAPVEPAEITLTVESLPPGAEVVLDGTVLGKTPYRGTLPRADREVSLVVRLAGYKDRKLTARATAPIAEAVKLDKKRSRQAGGGGDDRDDSVNPFAN